MGCEKAARSAVREAKKRGKVRLTTGTELV